MNVTKYQVQVDGIPVRFYINSETKVRSVDHDRLHDEFFSADLAHEKAGRWALTGYKVVPVQRDIGTPTRLTEVNL